MNHALHQSRLEVVGILGVYNLKKQINIDDGLCWILQ